MAEHIPISYRFYRRIIRVLLATLFRYQVYGVENILASGGCIIAANHASFLDPLIIGCGLWHRHVRFIARKTLFKTWISQWWAKSVGVVEIDRTKGDINALKSALTVLHEGGLLCLFPEGTRTADGHLQDARSGIGFLMAKAQVPVVPTYVAGTFAALPKGARMVKPHKIKVFFGKPILPPEIESFGTDREAYTKLAAFLMHRIAIIEADQQSYL